MSWTPERIAKLRQMWEAGYSDLQIAKALGGFRHCKDGGRNAVAGKAHRLGLPSKLDPSKPHRWTFSSDKRRQNAARTRAPWKPGDPKPDGAQA